MDIFVTLLLVFGRAGVYIGRPGYAGPGAGRRDIFYMLAGVVLIGILMRLLAIL
jgi:hypothetical protein